LGNEVLICKRCGRPLVRVEYKRRGNRVYVYGVHRDVLPDGKVRWYYHYLGPADRYVEVSKLHEDIFPQGLKGAYYDIEVGPRRIDYLHDLLDSLKGPDARPYLALQGGLGACRCYRGTCWPCRGAKTVCRSEGKGRTRGSQGKAKWR